MPGEQFDPGSISESFKPLDVEKAPQEYGLVLANSDARRSIYTINDPDRFLSTDTSVVPGGFRGRVKELFSDYPDGLKQYFVKTSPDPAVLANHFHTDSETGGTGDETFLFTDIPLGSSVTAEQYELGRAQGRIRYDIPAGTVVKNDPGTYHVFKIDGPVSFVQVTESPDFHGDDLKQFVPEEWSAEDARMVKGTMPPA